MEHYIAVWRYEISLLVLKKYRKIPKISPGACIFQRPFLRSLYLEGRFNGGFFCVASLGGLYLELRGAYFRNFTVFHSFAALMITREIFFNTRREISYLRAAMLYPLFPKKIFIAVRWS